MIKMKRDAEIARKKLQANLSQLVEEKKEMEQEMLRLRARRDSNRNQSRPALSFHLDLLLQELSLCRTILAEGMEEVAIEMERMGQEVEERLSAKQEQLGEEVVTLREKLRESETRFQESEDEVKQLEDQLLMLLVKQSPSKVLSPRT